MEGQLHSIRRFFRYRNAQQTLSHNHDQRFVARQRNTVYTVHKHPQRQNRKRHFYHHRCVCCGNTYFQVIFVVAGVRNTAHRSLCHSLRQWE